MTLLNLLRLEKCQKIKQMHDQLHPHQHLHAKKLSNMHSLLLMKVKVWNEKQTSLSNWRNFMNLGPKTERVFFHQPFHCLLWVCPRKGQRKIQATGEGKNEIVDVLKKLI